MPVETDPVAEISTNQIVDSLPAPVASLMMKGRVRNAGWRWHSLYWHPLQTTNAEVSVLSSQTSCEIIYCTSNIIFPAEQGQFDVLYPVPSIQGFLCHHSFLCYWFKICNPEWSDVPLFCLSLVYWSSGIKNTLLVTYFVSLLQPIYLTCKTLCSVQIHNFLPVCFPSVPQQ